MTLERHEQFNRAMVVMEKTPKHLFITGKAGTGKSTLLDYFRNTTAKNIAVLAPTGVAAVNVGGQTIHSFFQFKPAITPELVGKIRGTYGPSPATYKQLEAIVIDEISMVRADLLDCIDTFLRLNGRDKYQPFGGVQMIFFGDLYQLPPVLRAEEKDILAARYASPYFFDANVFQEISLEIIELSKIYRQSDVAFIEILNAIRENSPSYNHLASLNARYEPNSSHDPFDYYIYLTTTNARADEVNNEHLQVLSGNLHTYEGTFSGDFSPKDAPTTQELNVKIGAQVMLLNNDSMKRWVNGTIGKIVAIERDEGEPDCIVVERSDGIKIDVFPYTWESHAFELNAESQKVEARSTGSFTQYPLKLAWAVTIHKSQGKTFDRVIIDIGRGTFAHGQMYVALSRCRTLEGIILKQLIHKRHIIMDQRIAQFMAQFKESNYYRGAKAIDAPQQFAF